MFNASGTVLGVILLGLAIIQLKVRACAAARKAEGRGEAGGGARFFNGIFKEGFKLEVISMFMFEGRKSKSRVLARGLVNVRACVCT